VRWEDIEFDQKRLYIGKAKAGQRSQPLPPSLTESLKAEWKKLGSPKGYIFPSKCSTAKHPHRTSMALPFRRCVERAGLEPKRVTPHILRHTAITKLVLAGVDLPTIQRFSGHKTLEMVLRYTQLSDEHLDRSVAKLDDGLSAVLSPKLHTARTHATSKAA
jgi:integrase